jgi:hypothetical protein
MTSKHSLEVGGNKIVLGENEEDETYLNAKVRNTGVAFESSLPINALVGIATKVYNRLLK